MTVSAPLSLAMNLVAAYTDRDRDRIGAVAADVTASGHVPQVLEVVNAVAADMHARRQSAVDRLESGQIDAELLIRVTYALGPNDELSAADTVDDLLGIRLGEAFSRVAADASLLEMHLIAAYIAVLDELPLTD